MAGSHYARHWNGDADVQTPSRYTIGTTTEAWAQEAEIMVSQLVSDIATVHLDVELRVELCCQLKQATRRPVGTTFSRRECENVSPKNEKNLGINIVIDVHLLCTACTP